MRAPEKRFTVKVQVLAAKAGLLIIVTPEVVQNRTSNAFEKKAFRSEKPELKYHSTHMGWALSVMIFALAGRRIDPFASSRNCFPLRNVELVRNRIAGLFRNSPGRTLVCSAACGADLLALEAAGSLGWERRVILPFDRDRFRKTSVTDRPGEWGALYDRVLDQVEAARGLTVEPAFAGKNEFAAAGLRILSETESLAESSGEDRAAVLVWEGASMGPGDMTNQFAEAAKRRGFPLLHIHTLE